ncbi:hypothetical protein [Streptomyces sp. NPDC048521]|uniref:hypothetical protein n=1 Tax=Streptomyces sp. NPDC048521 TaxID=3365566 RepID=UPI003718339E
MKRSRRTLTAIAIAAIAVSVPVVLVVRGSGSPAPEGRISAEPNQRTTPSAANSEDFTLSLPLARYALTRHQGVILDRAEIKLQEACVRRLGGSELPPRKVPDASSAQETGRRYGLTDLESAEATGYQSPDSPRTNASLPRPNATQSMLLSGHAPSGKPVTTYKGHTLPEGGCNAESRRTLYEDHDKQPGITTARKIDIDSFRLSQQDPRVAGAFSEWSTCMKKAGYSYTSPLTVTDDPEFADAEVSARERAVATADVRCKRAIHLEQRWLAVESAIQKKLITENRDDLTRLSQSQQRMVRKARAILDGE